MSNDVQGISRPDRGQKGALARAEALPPERRSAIAKKAAQTRWDDSIPRATNVGSINLGDTEILCAVLGDKRRLLTQEGFLEAMGRARKAKAGHGSTSVDDILPFITAKNLEPFIHEDLRRSTRLVVFRNINGKKAYGYPAELLPEVCKVFLAARRAGALAPNQVHIADKCEMVVAGLATVGIIALIDEATGYQDERRKEELQALLDRYLRRELAVWSRQFPPEFYEQIFRLRGWEWRGRSFNPPQVVAYYTKDLVYARLAPGILMELQERMPRRENGKPKGKMTQLLTKETGIPALAQHLHTVRVIMRASNSWDEMMATMNRLLPRLDENLALPLLEWDREPKPISP